LLRVAEAVRVGPRRDVRAAVQFGFLPANFGPQYASLRDRVASGTESSLGFAAGRLSEPAEEDRCKPIDIDAGQGTPFRAPRPRTDTSPAADPTAGNSRPPLDPTAGTDSTTSTPLPTMHPSAGPDPTRATDPTANAGPTATTRPTPSVGLDPPGEGSQLVSCWDWNAPLSSMELPLAVQTLGRSDTLEGDLSELGPSTKIAGLDTWYFTSETSRVYGVHPGGSLMIVNAEACRTTLAVKDRDQIKYDDLKAMVENATFVDCNDPSTWLPPVA
jgi:hypothetical protein